MQYRHSFHLFTAIVLLMFLLLSSGCGGNNEPLGSNNTDISMVQIKYDAKSASWWLHFSSDKPVLCAINLGKTSSEGFTQLQSMDMTRPVREHNLELTLMADTRYRAMLTTFDTANNVERTQTFHFTATRNQDGNPNLIEETVTQLTAVNDLNPAYEIWQIAPNNSEVTSNSATLQFETDTATLASTAYGESKNFGLSERMAGGTPTMEHTLQLMALSAETTYHYNIIVIDESGELYQSENLTFITEQGSTPNNNLGNNIALLSLGASISSVSSNWNDGDNDSSFGANNAIDDDPNTEWSSNDDGNSATIEITLNKTYTVTGIGFWTRTMGSSAQITQFEVLTTDGISLGVFNLPDALQLYQFDIPDTQQKTLKFNVISSSSGNTGAKSIEIYQ